MKWKWLYVVLGASLALNLGVVGVLVYRRVDEGRWQRKMAREFGGRRQLKRLTAMLESHQPKMESLQYELRVAKWEFGKLGEQEQPDSAQVVYWLDVISQIERDRNRLMFDATREFWRMTPEERREKLRESARARWSGDRPSPPRGWRRRFRDRMPRHYGHPRKFRGECRSTDDTGPGGE